VARKGPGGRRLLLGGSALDRAAWLMASCRLRWLLLRWINPPFSAFMAERRCGLDRAATGLRFRHTWVDLARISPNLPLAVVASEDQKFPEHWGFDVEAIEKAYALNQHSHRVRGASTISQQVAKNLFCGPAAAIFARASRPISRC
jgi:monofunctional glycosyltransferase